MRTEAPNDPKLNDGEAIRCSAWLGVAAFRSWLGERRRIKHGKLGAGRCPLPTMLTGNAVPGESRKTLEELVALDLQGVERRNELFGGGVATTEVTETTGKASEGLGV